MSIEHTCHALLTYNRQALLDIENSHRIPVFTGFTPPELQLIVCPRSHHHHSREGPGALSWSVLAEPRRALRRRRHKRDKRGGLHARLKACGSRPPLPSLLLANVRSLENKLDELIARTTTQQEIRERAFGQSPRMPRSATDSRRAPRRQDCSLR